jgi:Flp pilus assembly protein TadG
VKRLSADDRGSSSVELVILAPLLVAMLLFVVLLGRFANLRVDVQGAARDAARTASLQRSATEASTSASDAAHLSLQTAGTSCSNLNVQTDTASFRAGGRVIVDIYCDVPMADLSLLSLGQKTVHARFIEPVDTYRGQQ